MKFKKVIILFLLQTFIIYANSVNIGNDKITYLINDKVLNIFVNKKLDFTYMYDERSGLYLNEIGNIETILENKSLLLKNITFVDLNKDGYKDLIFTTTLMENYKIFMLYDNLTKTFRPLDIHEDNGFRELKEFKGGVEANNILRIDDDGEIFSNRESLYGFRTDKILILLQSIEYDIEHFDTAYVKVIKYDEKGKETFLTCKYFTGIYNYEKDTGKCFEVLNKKNLVAYNNIAYYLQKAGANEEAVYLLGKILEKFPNRTVAYYNIGDAYWELGEKEKAVKAYYTYIVQMKEKGKGEKIPKVLLERVKGYTKPL